MNKEIRQILFETGPNPDSDGEQVDLDDAVLPATDITYSSGEDTMKELDIQILKQLQLRKQKIEKIKKNQNNTRKLLKFPNDFSSDKLSSMIEENFTEPEKTTLSKIRYDIHRALHKLIKNKKLKRMNEIPITFSSYPDSTISQPMLTQIQGELIGRGFGCELSAERAHTVKYKSRGVIINIIIK